MSPQTPVLERPPIAESQPALNRPPVTPQAPWPAPAPAPYGWQYVPGYPAPRSLDVVTSGQRLGLAIVTLIVMVPLVSVVLGVVVNSNDLVPGGWAVAAGLIGVALVSTAAVAINVVFNFDVLRPRR